MKKYQHIIWDWNGTLLDDIRLLRDIVNRILVKAGKDPLPDERHQELFEFPVIKYYTQMGFDFSKISYEQICLDFTGEYYTRFRQCRLREHAEAALEAFSQKGYTQSILSASQDTRLEGVLEFFKVRKYFKDVVGLDDHSGGTKLDSGRSYLKGTGLNPRQIVFIGDTAHDFEVAQALGSDCVLLDSGYQTRAKLLSCGCPVFDSLPSVHAHVIDSR